jgi:hypothetical protein
VVTDRGIQTVNRNVFKTLEKSITDFLNTTVWTNRVFEKNERIKANFYLVVKEYKNNRFTCELSVSAVRPVYNSSYETNLFTVSEKNISFEYVEYQQLTFNPEMLDNNLTATLAFYAYMIIGYDFDSFKMNAGRPYFQKAKEIVSTAEGMGMPGWENTGKFFSKSKWIDQLLLPGNIMFHKSIYTYHRLGLDAMSEDARKGKTNIIYALQYLEKLSSRDSDLLVKLFFDTKSDEIVQVLSGGPAVPNQKNVREILMRIAPMYRMKWEKI